MTGTAKYDLPTFFQKGRAFTLTSPKWVVDQVATDPSSATFALVDYDNTAIIAATPATVTGGSMGTATYAIGAAVFDGLDLPRENLREIWTFTVGGVTHTIEREAYLVRRAPTMGIDQDDIYALHSNFRNFIPPGQTTWDPQIRAAYVELVLRMINDAILPHKLINSWAFNQAHIYLTAERLCMDFAETRPEYLELAGIYRGKAADWYKKTVVKVDQDDDGDASDVEPLEAQPQLFFTDIPGC